MTQASQRGNHVHVLFFPRRIITVEDIRQPPGSLQTQAHEHINTLVVVAVGFCSGNALAEKTE
jgi:hypothetical protein